ncbi:RING-H2 finger protein ATL22-like [Corylus avellana]|uniref:RING-H2 finger protein ATL22-like n=1 Tax=Corylus avellana TaxID=13451 RepID=UPI00286B4C29|nr:RING-H2 finger protein ATL22-like [Corylus avellana]
MASSQVFVSSIFTFFILLPQITSSAVICKTSSCGDSENPLVKFPFRLKGTDADQSCGYPGFDLSCNNQNQTILTLPSGDVVVEIIDYYEQSIYIDFDDPDHCFAGRLLQNFTLSGTPFQFPAFRMYVTFLNCSANVTMIHGQAIDCVSGDGYKIWITPSAYLGFLMTLPPSCQVILMALAPMSQLSPTRLLMHLTWGEPSCGECVAGGGYCARKSATTLDVGCFPALSSPSSNGTKTNIVAKVLLISRLVAIH